MGRNNRPDASYISQLKSRLETRHSNQDNADEKWLSYYKQSHLKDIWNPKVIGDFDAKTVGSGAVGLIVDQDVTVLDGNEVIRVNALPGKDSRQAERWASQTAEPWLALARPAARRRQQLSSKKIQDLRLYGRAWTTVLPTRKVWAGPDFKQGEKESNEDFNARVEKQRKTRFPIKWRHTSARGVWPVRDEDGDVVEVIEVRKVEPSVIKEEFPEANLNDKEDVDIVRYANHKYVGVFIPGKGKEDGQGLGEPWEHHLGRLPYVLFEGDPMPSDDNEGLMWRSAAYHVLSLVQALDETLSDVRTAARLEVVGPTIVTQDPDARAAYGGFDKDFKIKPGDTVNLFPNESVERQSAAVLNESLIRLLGYLKPLLDEVAMARPALLGQLASGESGTALRQAAQRAEIELTQGQKSLQEGAAEECVLFFRCVTALDEMFPDVDAVTVRSATKGSKEVSIEPKGILEYEPLVQVTIAQNLPVDEGANLTNYSIGVEKKAFSRQTGREIYLRMEDPLGEDDKIKAEEIDDVLHLAGLEILKQRAFGPLLAANAMSDQQVVQEMGNAAPDEVETMAQIYEMESSPEIANMIRGNANKSRIGRGQRENVQSEQV